MNVFLNNKSCFIEKEINLSSFLTEIKIEVIQGIAIAINDTIIPKPEWNDTILKHNDQITLITATAGG